MWTSPFSLPGNWFKGNLHTHTTQSDGMLTPEQAIEWYEEQGYDFLALSDHWVLTPGKRVSPSFITITGCELHGPGYHMLTLGLSLVPDQELAESPQSLTTAVIEAGGLAFFAHPYWMGQTSADIANVQGISGIEVFNSVCQKMDGLGYARVQWDELLAQGLQLTGLAVDDVHWKHDAQGQGFIMVRAERLEEPLILDAIRQGHFYASTGPNILDLRVIRLADGQPALRVHCSPCHAITFYADGPKGHRFEALEGEMLDSAVYPIKAEQVYLRVECQDASGGVAWSNPLFVENVLSAE